MRNTIDFQTSMLSSIVPSEIVEAGLKVYNPIEKILRNVNIKLHIPKRLSTSDNVFNFRIKELKPKQGFYLDFKFKVSPIKDIVDDKIMETYKNFYIEILKNPKILKNYFENIIDNKTLSFDVFVEGKYIVDSKEEVFRQKLSKIKINIPLFFPLNIFRSGNFLVIEALTGGNLDKITFEIEQYEKNSVHYFNEKVMIMDILGNEYEIVFPELILSEKDLKKIKDEAKEISKYAKTEMTPDKMRELVNAMKYIEEMAKKRGFQKAKFEIPIEDIGNQKDKKKVILEF